MKNKSIALIFASIFAISACGKDPQSASLGVKADVGKSIDAATGTETKSGVTNDSKAGNTLTAATTIRNVVTGMFITVADEQPDAFKDVNFSQISPRNLFPYGENGPTAPKPDRNGNRLPPSEYQRNQMAAIIAYVVSPVIGWPSRHVKSEKSREKYMAMLAVSNVFAKNVFKRIFPYVPVAAARQPGEAQKITRQVWDDISTRELCEIWDHSVEESKLKLTDADRFRVDGTGGTSAIQFAVGLLEIHGDAKGFSYSKAGVPMFDDQYIDGQKIELAMDRGEATTASSGFSSNKSVKASGTKGVSGSAELKGQ